MYLSLSVCCGGLSHPLSGLPNRGPVAYARMGQEETGADNAKNYYSVSLGRILRVKAAGPGKIH